MKLTRNSGPPEENAVLVPSAFLTYVRPSATSTTQRGVEALWCSVSNEGVDEGTKLVHRAVIERQGET
jgi:hypothetical protein